MRASLGRGRMFTCPPSSDNHEEPVHEREHAHGAEGDAESPERRAAKHRRDRLKDDRDLKEAGPDREPAMLLEALGRLLVRLVASALGLPGALLAGGDLRPLSVALAVLVAGRHVLEVELDRLRLPERPL